MIIINNTIVAPKVGPANPVLQSSASMLQNNSQLSYRRLHWSTNYQTNQTYINLSCLFNDLVLI